MLSFSLENEGYDINVTFFERELKKLMPNRNFVLMDIMTSDVSDFNRIKNILGKVGKSGGIPENFIKMGDLFIDISSKKAKIGDSMILLTKTEFEILLMLVSSPFAVHSHQQIASAVWKTASYVSSHTVDVHISRLRKKLGSKAHYICSRPGFGYEFNSRRSKKPKLKQAKKR
jgi:DNA-binding winged helix-turn-helix (wHTH) protein